jgi:NAD-dependent deacetylase
MLDPEVIEAAWNAVEDCELLVAVGASLAVEPAASLPWRALDKGAYVIEVNPSPTDLAEYCHASFAATAVDVLPGLLDLVADGRR